MNSLEHRARIADIRRTCQANRSRYLGSNIGENVTIQVGQNNHIESLRRISELGRADINYPCLISDIRIFLRNLIEDPVKQAIRQLHDIVFHEAGNLLAVMAARILKGVTNDLLTARTTDEH